MKRTSTQHDLMVRVLEAAGGQAIESLVPAGYTGSIADILFAEDDVIVEVKSLTTDRAKDEGAIAEVKALLAENRHLGAPDPETTVSFGLRDIPQVIAEKVLRIVGRRVQNEVKSANKQIKATKAVLGRPEALGVLAIITQPFGLDRLSVIWLTGDRFRTGNYRSVNLVFLVETPLKSPAEAGPLKNSFLSAHSRDGRELPQLVLEAIFKAWGEVTGQEGRDADSDDFTKFGATS
jgi:hypothetical protein